MYRDTYRLLEKLAISNEELKHLAHLTKQKYRVPKSLSTQTFGPTAGGFPQRVKEPRLRFGRDMGIATSGMSLKEYEKLLVRNVPTVPAKKALLGDKRVILAGPRGGTTNSYLAALQRQAGLPVKKLPGSEKALLSRLFWAHEGMEQAAKKHVPGSIGHAAPEVLVKETNLLNTLSGVDPKAKKNVRSLLTASRANEPLTRISYTVGSTPFEWTYGQGARNLQTGSVLPRVSRHHRKAITRAVEGLARGAAKDSLFGMVDLRSKTTMSRTNPAPLRAVAKSLARAVGRKAVLKA